MFTKAEIIEKCQQRMNKNPKDAANDAFSADGFRPGMNLALLILSSSLFEKKQWNGRDYAEHPVIVGMSGTKSEAKQIIGILHDVVEDSDWTTDDLRACGFTERICEGVASVTKNEGELYLDFIERCSLNPDGIDVKLNDLEHNMSNFRNPTLLNDRGIAKQNLYIISKEYLVAIKKGDLMPGTSMRIFISSRPDLGADLDLIAANSIRYQEPDRSLVHRP